MQLEILNALKNVIGKVKCPRIQPMLKMCQILELENLFEGLHLLDPYWTVFQLPIVKCMCVSLAKE